MFRSHRWRQAASPAVSCIAACPISSTRFVGITCTTVRMWVTDGKRFLCASLGETRVRKYIAVHNNNSGARGIISRCSFLGYHILHCRIHCTRSSTRPLSSQPATPSLAQTSRQRPTHRVLVSRLVVLSHPKTMGILA